MSLDLVCYGMTIRLVSAYAPTEELGTVNQKDTLYRQWQWDRFSHFLISNELVLTNTWFEHKRIRRDTWYSNTGKFSKIIDYIAISRWINQYTEYTIDCRVR